MEANHKPWRRDRWTLYPTKRVRLTGRLRMRSALHVGGGVGTQSITDAAVLRHADGRPFIPGSSLKGALRSHLERLAQTEALLACGITSCGLFTDSATSCPTPTWIDENKDATKAEDKDFEALCHTCTLFGSPILAGKIRVPDLEVEPESNAALFEIRDGVGIDRDSGKAVPKIKFDFEVVPTDTVFAFELSVDSPDDKELALVAVAVREMEHGHVAVGGKTTRGLGACVLEDLAVYVTDFGTPTALKEHLLARAPTPEADAETFLDNCIEALFS